MVSHYFFRSAVFITALLISAAIVNAEESLYSVSLHWTDDQGQAVQLRDFRGELVVLTMAYTRCKSACPLTIERLRKMKKALEAEGKHAEFVIVSLDPENDSAMTLKAYREMKKLTDSHWHLLVGSPLDLQKLAVLLGVNYQKDSQNDEIMHSNKLVVLNTEGEVLDSLEGLSSDVEAFARRISQY